jgi:hypothetical protein
MAIYRANSLILRKVIPSAYSFGKGSLASDHGLVLKLFVLQLNDLLFPLPFSRLVLR